MMNQVKVNSITTFGTCCINNPIGICRDASEESVFRNRETSKTRGPNGVARRTWSQSRWNVLPPEKSKKERGGGVTDVPENWFLVFFGLHRLDESCS